MHLRLYDVMGQEIAVVVDENLTSGYFQKCVDIDDVDGKKLPNGVYFDRLTAGDYVATKSMTVLR
ncbi:MAG: hypothetical protein JSV53_08995 [candidate division WOR-3 bacterium]|nr:MAG: hypothetical protein JSV53_08995 [candidate division WOR-3 bacterium]